MSTRQKILGALAATTVIVAGLHFPANAGISSSAVSTAWTQTTCPEGAEATAELARLHDDIAHAASLDEARTLALAPTDAALDALDKARIMMPLSQDLQKAQTRLEGQRSRIKSAETPPQVADEFTGMMLAGLDDDRLVNAKVGSHGCSYSSGETIAIVIGLILGIIPGLILLVVLC